MGRPSQDQATIGQFPGKNNRGFGRTNLCFSKMSSMNLKRISLVILILVCSTAYAQPPTEKRSARIAERAATSQSAELTPPLSQPLNTPLPSVPSATPAATGPAEWGSRNPERAQSSRQSEQDALDGLEDLVQRPETVDRRKLCEILGVCGNADTYNRVVVADRTDGARGGGDTTLGQLLRRLFGSCFGPILDAFDVPPLCQGDSGATVSCAVVSDLSSALGVELECLLFFFLFFFYTLLFFD